MIRMIQALAHICEAHRFTEKLLFMPSYATGLQLCEYLARTGTSWINLRVTTPTGYAGQMLSGSLATAGKRLLEQHETLIIIETLYRADRTLREGLRYFGEVEAMPGIIEYLGRSLTEMRMAGLSSRMFNPGAFLTLEKGEELLRLMKSYEAFLAANKIVDRPALLKDALDKAQEWPALPEDSLVMAVSDVPFNFLEREFIRKVGGDGLLLLDHSIPFGLRVPRRFFSPPASEKGRAPAPERDIELLSWLFSPQDAPVAKGDGSVALFHALGESNEVREVFRRILGSKTWLDDVEILITGSKPYISTIFELAQSLEVPVTFASGIPIAYTRPGRALMLFLDWQAEDFHDTYLRSLLAEGLLDIKKPGVEGDRPMASRVARLLLEAAICWGRDRYLRRLQALRENYRLKAQAAREEGEDDLAGWYEKRRVQTAWVSSLVVEILDTVPQPEPDGTVTTSQVFLGAKIFLEKFCRTASDLDALAKNRLTEFLDSMGQAPALVESAKQVADRLKKMVEEISVGASRPRPGHMHVTHYKSGGVSGRGHTFVLGLDQNRFPGAALQDPVILDKERLSLSKDLALSNDLVEENIYLMAKALGSLRGGVTFSYSCRDLKEDREVFPSSLMLGVYRVATLDRRGNYQDLLKFLGEPVGFIPRGESSPLSDWEWWLSQRQVVNFGKASVYENYPHLEAGDRAEEQRILDRLTEYDGWIPTFAGSEDTLQGEVTISPSRLEGLARCPFAFFLQHKLGIEPMEETERDLGQWLSPLQRGELLHEVFYRFMEALKAKGEKVSRTSHQDLLERLALEEVAHFKEEVPPASDFAYQREVKEIKQACLIFLTNEEARSGEVDPQFFELSFGLKGGATCAASTEQPVEIRLPRSGSFKLRGRIDRIDRVGDHEYEVWDYKTGSSFGYKDESYINRGRLLQHALYAEAAEFLLRQAVDPEARVVRAGYFFPSPKGEGLRIHKDPVAKDTLFEALEDLFDLLRKGVFPSSYDEDSCGICDYSKICGGPGEAVTRLKEKIENDPKLKPLLRLKDYV
jgi:ATP-dependent helicase/nuclease subunit B